METTERFEPLTAEELESVRGSKTGDTGCLIVGTILIVLIGGALVFMMTLGSLRLGPVAPAVVALVAAGLVVLLYFYTRSEKRKADRDLSEGRKRVVTAEAHHVMKSSEGSRRRGSHVTLSYYVEVGGREYKVTEEDYYKFKKGMIVEAHTTPHGGRLLGIYDANTKELLFK